MTCTPLTGACLTCHIEVVGERAYCGGCAARRETARQHKRAMPRARTTAEPVPHVELIKHPGRRYIVDHTDRTSEATPFADDFMADPFNLLVAATPDLPCVNRWDVFSPPESPPHHPLLSTAEEHIAKSLCDTCPIQAECLEYAMRPGPEGGLTEVGIWGGTSDVDRDRLRKKRRAAVR